jgi:hypothetical protein
VLVKLADEEIRRTMIIAQQRNLKPFSDIFAHEFSPVPLSLCDSNNIDLFNQQAKAKVIDFLIKMYPSFFSSSCPISTNRTALVIDGGSLLEVKSRPDTRTIRDYAIQLLENNIRYLFSIHVILFRLIILLNFNFFSRIVLISYLILWKARR